MGDFEYDEGAINPLSSDCSSSDFSEEMELNAFADTNEKLIADLTNQLRHMNEEVKIMINRIDNTEEDILKRRDFVRDMERLYIEYTKQIGREEEQIEKIEFLTDHLKNNMITRDEVLDSMRVLENSQLAEHFTNRKSNTSIVSCQKDSDVFTSVASQ
ncbi:hypothetical protein HHI36_001973 [Cryptolaemus montrouzieri]|uniref:Uncharacterized protein n=1 Tax=Cryptolaemus montrouzieri TaxID=559131 RepID=A0ABD2P999_9CUCU